MRKSTQLPPKVPLGNPERAVRAAPENTAKAFTPAEADARRTMAAIATAEAEANAEIAARDQA